MQHFLIRRGLYVILMLVLVSIVGFVVINLPPGDFMDAYLARMQSSGTEVDRETADNLRRNYGLDKPLYVQYLIWFFGVVRGDFGWSFDHQIPVSDLVKERIALTLVISLCTMIFVYAAAIPIGIVSAVRQYSLTDYTVTLFGFVGLATPNFLLALLLMYFGFQIFDADVGVEDLKPEVHQQQRKQEVGRGQTDEAEQGHRVVGQRVLPHGADDADRDRRRVDEDHGAQGDHQGQRDALLDQVADRNLVVERPAEVAAHHAEEPDQVLHVERLVEAVVPAQVVGRLPVDLGARRLHARQVGVHEVPRRQVDHHESHDGDQHQHEDHVEAAAYQEVLHG